jgi:hypothetical protein
MTERAEPELRPLYLPLYFDEDVSNGVVENLRTRGFDVLSARDGAMLRRTDDEQLAFAIEQRRALVTHNRVDFELRHRLCLENKQLHYGILIARRRRRDEALVARLLELLNTVTAEEMQNQLRYL